MLLSENNNTEFKREFTSDIKKTAVAFANTNGGKIYVGVLDDGTIIGIDDTDSVIRQLTDSIRDSVKPDIARIILRNEDLNRPGYIFVQGTPLFRQRMSIYAK